VESGEVSEVSEEEGGFVDFLLPPNWPESCHGHTSMANQNWSLDRLLPNAEDLTTD
jgi:hypothetical protein